MLGDELLNAINEARLLGIFKNFYDNNNDYQEKKKIRNVLALSKNKKYTIIEIIKREQKVELKDIEAERMLQYIIAFLNKKDFRISIDEKRKNRLLKKQHYKCAICSCDISEKSHTDHIVPFKYVGDCLENNLQMLCKHCNEAKNDSLDYQIRFLLKLI